VRVPKECLKNVVIYFVDPLSSVFSGFGDQGGLLGISEETQIRHAAHVKENTLSNTYKTKEYVFARGAPRHKAGSLRIQMRLGKALDSAAMRALSLCSRNIHGEDVAQFTRGSVAIEVVVGV
jgi:hypothetical protein